jgi:myosin-crossreactive antigen
MGLESKKSDLIRVKIWKEARRVEIADLYYIQYFSKAFPLFLWQSVLCKRKVHSRRYLSAVMRAVNGIDYTTGITSTVDDNSLYSASFYYLRGNRVNDNS